MVSTNLVVGEYHGRRNITQQTQVHLPDDIAIEILSRLPRESIFKFKSVCKTWQSLFSEPSFIRLHRNNQNETLLICPWPPVFSFLLHIKYPKTTLNLHHPFHNLAPSMDIVGSINGLICLGCYFWAQSFMIWNPVTNQYKYLPRPKITSISSTMYTISSGFCYHPPTKDYIVVRIARFERDEKDMSKVELYSLNSDSWRIVEIEVDYSLFMTCDTIVMGKPYWWAGSYGHRFLVGFDICDNLLFTKVPTFKATAKNFGRCKLANYNSSLAVLVDSNLSLSSLTSEYLGFGNSLEHEFSERSISMFVLRGDGSWGVRLRVGFPRGIARMIGCSVNGRIVLEDKSGMIMLFDTENEKIENTNIVWEINSNFTISNYTASFVPIKGSKTGT